MRNYRAAREKALVVGILSLAAIATEGLALAQYHQGYLRQSAQSCREVIDLGKRGAGVSLPLAAAGHIELAGICYEWNELREVERHLKLGMALCRQGGDGTILAEAYLVQSRLYKSQGDVESAFEALRQADQVLAAIPASVTHFKLDIQRIGLYLSTARLDDAVRRLREMDERASYAEFRPISLYEMRQMSWARVHLAQGRPQQALTLLNELMGPSESGGRLRFVMEMLLLKALALQALGQMEAALAAFGRSLALAEPGGVLRLYLDEGAPALALLRESARRGISAAYANRLLALWLPKPPGLSADDLKLITPLTPTELKILLLIAGGCSNREITEQMVIALNTVKRHSSHIYAKLNVKSRTQAIVRARQLGLLPTQSVS
jgi:LuxR family maltose regulon positive regulatory protein